MDPVNEIKSRIPIEQLVAQYVQLKKAGSQLKALCPFHSERTPSFYVSPQRQIAYCFGCNKGGDHFKFIQEIEGLDFRGALEFLAEKTGVALPKRGRIDPSFAAERKSERDRLIELHEAASGFFEKNLWDTKEGEKVLEYVRRRCLKDDAIRAARLGFAPDSVDELSKFLLAKDFTRDEIIRGGLAFARDTEASGCIDRFRMRLIFPIRNASGNMAAFAGRAVREGDEPKYLNSPETPIFHKSSFLYGLYEARGDIRTHDAAIFVEGYMDGLSSHQAGFKNVIATSGTALTSEQLTVAKRFTKNVIFAFDQDAAGTQARLRAIELALPLELSVRVAVWESEAKDPDELCRKNPEIFGEALKNAMPALEFVLKNAIEQFGEETVDDKKKIIQELLPFLTHIQSPVELDEWIKKIADLLSISVGALYDELKRYKGAQKHVLVGTQQQKKLESTDLSVNPKSSHAEEYFIGLLLTYPSVIHLANQLIPYKFFQDIELQNIYRHLTTQYNHSLDEKVSEPINTQRLDILAVYAQTLFEDMTEEAAEKEVRQASLTLTRINSDREKRSLITRLRQASGDEKRVLLEEYEHLLAAQSHSTLR